MVMQNIKNMEFKNIENVEFCYAPFDIKKVQMKSSHPVHLPNRPRKSVGWSLVFERKSQIGLCFL